jgi:hypothetical protein
LTRGKPRPFLEKLPVVYLGPRASLALRGAPGVLLGARRPAWIDVLEFEPCTGGGLRRLVASRFQAHPPWDVVGLSLPAAELQKRGKRLLNELVPGDVLLTERGPRLHSGVAWVRARLVGEGTKSYRSSTKSPTSI